MRRNDKLYCSRTAAARSRSSSNPTWPLERTIANVKAVLAACGSSLEKVVDVTAFLVDMDRDFAGYNEVYAKHFGGIQAARTTIAIRALPTPIAVELKVVALAE